MFQQVGDAFEQRNKATKRQFDDFSEKETSGDSAAKSVKCPKSEKNKAIATLVENQRAFWKILQVCTENLPGLIAKEDAAIEAMTSICVEAAKSSESMAEALSNLQFHGGKFAANVDWISFPSHFTKIGAGLAASIQELQQLSTPKKKPGRPFGALNQKRPQGDDDDQEFADEPKKKKRRQKSKAKEDGDVEQDEDQEQEKTKKRQRKRKPRGDDDDDAEGSDESEKQPNKSRSIPLYRKCQIVEHALQLKAEGTVYRVEKEIMALYSKEFSNADGKLKTGLLSKWMRRGHVPQNGVKGVPSLKFYLRIFNTSFFSEKNH